MSPLWRAAATAAAARGGLSRTPSVAAHGRCRAMASSSSSSSDWTSSFKLACKEGARVMILVTIGIGFGTAMFLSQGTEAKKRPISREAHEEEIKGIREEMKKLQASNDEILALLKTDPTRTGGE